MLPESEHRVLSSPGDDPKLQNFQSCAEKCVKNNMIASPMMGVEDLQWDAGRDQKIPQNCTEVIRGEMMLSTCAGLDHTQQTLVSIRVYRTSFCHFAAVFPPKKYCNPVACINLKHYKPELVNSDGEQLIYLRPKSCDGSALLLKLYRTGGDVDGWLKAMSEDSCCDGRMQRRCKRLRPNLPALTESEDE